VEACKDDRLERDKGLKEEIDELGGEKESQLRAKHDAGEDEEVDG